MTRGSGFKSSRQTAPPPGYHTTHTHAPAAAPALAAALPSSASPHGGGTDVERQDIQDKHIHVFGVNPPSYYFPEPSQEEKVTLLKEQQEKEEQHQRAAAAAAAEDQLKQEARARSLQQRTVAFQQKWQLQNRKLKRAAEHLQRERHRLHAAAKLQARARAEDRRRWQVQLKQQRGDQDQKLKAHREKLRQERQQSLNKRMRSWSQACEQEENRIRDRAEVLNKERQRLQDLRRKEQERILAAAAARQQRNSKRQQQQQQQQQQAGQSPTAPGGFSPSQPAAHPPPAEVAAAAAAAGVFVTQTEASFSGAYVVPCLCLFVFGVFMRVVCSNSLFVVICAGVKSVDEEEWSRVDYMRRVVKEQWLKERGKKAAGLDI